MPSMVGVGVPWPQAARGCHSPGAGLGGKTEGTPGPVGSQLLAGRVTSADSLSVPKCV